MADLIDRQQAIDAINALHDKPNAWLDCAVETVEALPSAEPERKKGKWMFATSKSCYVCKDCGAKLDSIHTNFCGECGADMRGDSDG